MTIAIGLLATDGVVIAADTQESAGYPGDMKSSGTKILWALRSNASNPPVTGAFAVSGAGTVGNLDAVNQKLAESFCLSAGNTLNDLTALLNASLDDFYTHHVLLPQERKDKHFDLVLGATQGNDTRLWLSDQTVLRRSNTYGAVGSGAEYATVLLSRIYTQLPLSKATVLAAYTIFLVKEFVEGCGKNTEVVVLDGGQARMLADSDIALMEYHFNHALKLDSMMVHYIIGRRVPDENAALNNLTGYLKSLRTSLEENPNITAEIRGWDIDWDE